MTRVAVSLVIALVAVGALAGCRMTPSAAPVEPPSATAPASTPVASSAPVDPLSDVDSALLTADAAVQQSLSDLDAGDASAAKNDDH